MPYTGKFLHSPKAKEPDMDIIATRIDNETIEISVGSSKTVLSVPEIEQLQKNLAQLRGTLLPAVTLTPAPKGQPVYAIPDPVWKLDPEALHTGMLLQLRNPEHGWLSFLIPNDEALKMAKVLTEAVEKNLESFASYGLN